MEMATHAVDSVANIRPGLPPGLFSREVYMILLVLFKFCLLPVVAVIGVCANIINVLVFYKMGLSDGVTQNYFILAISDGLFALVSLINAITYSVVTLAGTSMVYNLSYYATLYPQLVSLATTVVISVVRSFCVAMPLQVKHRLTRKRQLAAILLLSGTVIFLLTYAIAPMRLVYSTDPRTNNTIPFFAGVTEELFAPLVNFSFIGSFVVVIITVVVMARSLGKASKFRDSTATAQSTEMDSGTQKKAADRRLRDLRVVRKVVLVAVVFIVTNTPLIVFILLRVFVPEMRPRGRYKYALQVGTMLRDFFTLLNASLNIVIYVTSNTRYRATLWSLVGRTKSGQ